jgi:hypothetical protein
MFAGESPQLALSHGETSKPKKGPKPSGDLWNPSSSDPATVPIPLPVVMVRVEGPFTALDRKLWLILLHHAWPDLDQGKTLHTISIAALLRLFRQHGRHDLGQRGELKFGKTDEETHAAAIWSSVRRLVSTKVEWEHEDYQGVAALLADALMNRQHRQSGWLHYSFGQHLAKNLLLPNVFARLRTHLMMKLRSKYAVTLYEILEAYANRQHPICEVSIDELRVWLKVPDDACYKVWRDLRKRVIDIAVDEINANAADSGFVVEYEAIRKGKAFSKIKFTVTKTDTREDRDAALSRQAKALDRRRKSIDGLADPDNPPNPSSIAIDAFRDKWPGHDPYDVIDRFQDKWRGEGCAVIRKPDGAFLKFAEGMFKSRATRPRKGSLVQG